MSDPSLWQAAIQLPCYSQSKSCSQAMCHLVPWH